LKNIFGEFAAMSDSRQGIEAAVRAALADRDGPRRRAAALRWVLGEHTYVRRMRTMTDAMAGCPDSPPAVVDVALFAAVGDVGQARSVVGAAARQEGVAVRLTLISDDPQVARKATGLADGLPCVALTWAEARSADVAEAGGLAEFAAVLSAEDWYGPHYLRGLTDAFAYSEAGLATKECHRVRTAEGVVVVGGGSEYRLVDAARAQARRSVVVLSAMGELAVADLVAANLVGGAALRERPAVSVDGFDSCEGGAGLGAEATGGLAADPPVALGLPLDQMAVVVERSIEEWKSAGGPRILDSACFPSREVTSKAGSRLVAVGGRRGLVVAGLAEDERAAVPLRGTLPARDLDPRGKRVWVLSRAAGAQAAGTAFTWRDASGKRVGGRTVRQSTRTFLDVPPGARDLDIRLSVTGPGPALFDPPAFAPEPVPPVLPGRARALIVTDNYPAYGALYRNAFVHSRIREYAKRGHAADVFIVKLGTTLAYREFDGVEIASGGANALRQLIDSGNYDTIGVHFLNRTTWNALEPWTGSVPIIVWAHGWEIQPWWRRSFIHATPDEADAAKEASEKRTQMWREVFAKDRPGMTVVFVSKFFRDQVVDDLAKEGVGIVREKTRVIHNPVDTDRFRYEEKAPELRKRILLIRPFATTIYGNDLAVKAILDLAEEPWFGELGVRIIGDGRLFAETTAPLVGLDNVVLERRFLLHDEMAALHREFGVFLVPTRMDTHGVARDEAMASGLVPVTSAVAAVPEFVGEEEGFLVPDGDYRGLADAIREMYHDPAVFLRKSAAAARRVRRQASADVVIEQEMALLWPKGGGTK
jgi:glycosyltransferase involved in cell wall biosynthesis